MKSSLSAGWKTPGKEFPVVASFVSRSPTYRSIFAVPASLAVSEYIFSTAH